MSAWVLIECLDCLRDEFNRLSPGRDKGADGSIGDSAHTSRSDHTPDEDSDYLRDHDADSKNEVHALDVDSSGPWPGSGTQKERFHRIVMGIVAQERKRWLDPDDKCRLKYVIWDGRIYGQDNDFAGEPYTGTSDPHTSHAHFSGRYETSCENDTRPWGVYKEDEVTDEDIKAIAKAVWAQQLEDPTEAGRMVAAGTYLRYIEAKRDQVMAEIGKVISAVKTVQSGVNALGSGGSTTADKIDALARQVAALAADVEAIRNAVAPPA